MSTSNQSPMQPSGREISGDFTMADAMYVPREVVKNEHLLDRMAIRLLALNMPFLTNAVGIYDPHLTYVRCEDAGNRPFNHKGDWPEEGQWYLARPVSSRADGVPGMRLIGFSANAPYYNSYSIERFLPQPETAPREFDQIYPFMCMN